MKWNFDKGLVDCIYTVIDATAEVEKAQFAFRTTWGKDISKAERLQAYT